MTSLHCTAKVQSSPASGSPAAYGNQESFKRYTKMKLLLSSTGSAGSSSSTDPSRPLQSVVQLRGIDVMSPSSMQGTPFVFELLRRYQLERGQAFILAAFDQTNHDHMVALSAEDQVTDHVVVDAGVDVDHVDVDVGMYVRAYVPACRSSRPC